ncbi:hypothetical protein CH373_05985 [Leptospira perolatii]|uniref:Uncharacterized protein n=1 Tax=Leptospira perolatii TaxID=2023191 RepID=A0A2M9ZR42_9LEPT|nr:hypothetical protein CH360_16420 [Leptospira perolatii]PJZ74441.1 hypothetical protein CH373_05985 [Leptospira perolatii]
MKSFIGSTLHFLVPFYLAKSERPTGCEGIGLNIDFLQGFWGIPKRSQLLASSLFGFGGILPRS